MEIQEFVTKSVTSQFRFEALAPLFFNVRGSLIKELMAEFDLTEWSVSDQFIEVFAEDQSRALIVSAGEVRVIFENPDDFDECFGMAKRALLYVLSELDVEDGSTRRR